MKNIVRSVLFVIVLLLVGDLFMQVSARHDLDPKCYTFQGQGTGVPSAGGSGQPAGIFNSGMIDFDAYDSSHKFQACGEVNADGNLEISGWAWNTNLGDISFRCEAGLNFSVPCGVIEYGSSISNINGTDYLVGYAWGDNFGWLSLGCMDYDGDGLLENYQYGVVDNDRPGNRMACGSVEYGTEVSADGSLVGYGYAESVGRMNTTGTSIDWPVLDVDPPDADADGIPDDPVTVQNDPDATPLDPDDANDLMPIGRFTGYAFANGEDYYTVSIQVLEDGAPLTCAQIASRNITGITLSPNPLIALENIRYDQTTLGSLRGAMTIDVFTCDPATNTYSTKLRSISPTMSDPSGSIDYDDFVLEDISFVMDDFRGVARSMSYSFGSEPLTFVPPVYVESLETNDTAGERRSLIFASRNTSVPVYMEGGRYRDAGLVPANELVTISGSYTGGDPYLFFDDPEGDGPLYVPSEGPIEDQNSTAISMTAQTLSGIAGSEAGVSRDPAPHTRYVYAYLDPSDPAPESQVDSSRIELTVDFTALGAHAGRLVRYLTATVEPGITFNQFAQLRGNLRLDEGAFQEVVARKISADCVGELCEERAQTGLPAGEYNQSQVRQRIQKILIERFRGRSSAITKVVGGFEETISEAMLTSDSDNILYYKRNGGTGPFLLRISEAIDNIPVIKPTTIICEGCDFYIDENISNNTSGVPPTIKLGLIALEDFTIQSGSRGGNVYVHANVTETALHIFADGSFMSYSEDADIDPDADDPTLDGIPDFGTAAIRDILDNQYTNYGRIRSNNTLGGSTLLPAITGEGERATTQALQYKARMQDLNFLRYAKTVGNTFFDPLLSIEENMSRDINNGPPFWWATDSGITLSPSLGIGTERNRAVVNYPLAYGIVNFFDSSSSGLPIFEALSTISR